jgi:hypothetical protein
VPSGYLVYSPSCKIPSLDPFAPDVMEIFYKKNDLECWKTRPLTSIDQDFKNDIVKVLVHHEHEEIYFKENGRQLNCYYKEVKRKLNDDKDYE